ncbi:MAG TPA: NfeD family protein [Bryobacteraceae bacterium]|nr:NfeD family protein [Bryobacteraceae bacterium]
MFPFLEEPTWYGMLLLVIAVLLLTVELKFYTHMISGITGAILLAFGIILLFPAPDRISPAFATAVSVAIGIIIVFLGTLGMRARKAKLLMGIETLVGQTGVSSTPLDPAGTVMVNGEYWQARSNQAIPAGQAVRVERVDNMTIWVREA